MIDSISRALRMLSFLADHNEIGVRELSRAFEVNEATAYRTLITLQKHGYIIQDAKTKKYKLGFETVRIGQSCLNNYDLVQVARKYAIELSREINETITLLARYDNYAVYVNKIDSTHVVRIHLQIGSKIQLTVGGYTKPIVVFLSEKEQLELIGSEQLEKVRGEISRFKGLGYTISDDEVDSGVTVIGCPIYNYEAKIIGALNVPIPKVRIDEQKISEIIPHLQMAAQKISIDLGYRA